MAALVQLDAEGTLALCRAVARTDGPCGVRAGDDIEIVKEVSDIGSGGQVRGRLLLAG